MTLLDSSHKKVLFLEEVCDHLSLDCPVVNQRCEEFRPLASDRYDIVVSRAVARLKRLWGLSSHLLLPGGLLYTVKGENYQEEIDELSAVNLKSDIIAPDENWHRASDYLNQKYIVKLEN
jgi:16S rRNA (guanine527-N7)-methyltransferase